MVSQKAFKESAIQLGKEKGLTPEQVIEIGLDKSIDVLENKHDPSHRTNFSDSAHPESRRQTLIEKNQKEKSARQKES